jgi:hypothetical protein
MAKVKAGYSEDNGATNVVGSLKQNVDDKLAEIKEKEDAFEQLKKYKIALNQLFYSRYSRFIQEGTWLSEEYIDDDKYYNDALSVMYNSCYP